MEEERAFSLELARQVEHEDKVWKFSNAVVSLAELARESKDTLALIVQDSGYLPHGAVTPDHITEAWQVLTKVTLVQVGQQ
jgi:hypothetical protein